MKLPGLTPLKENIVIVSPGDLLREIQSILSTAEGAFIKIFGKKSGQGYYMEILMDRSKILAIEGQEVGSGKNISGEEALSLFRELIKGPVIVDLYALDEIGVKLSIADNLEAYAETPKVPIADLFFPEESKTSPQEVAQTAPQAVPEPAKPPEEKKPEPTQRAASARTVEEVEIVNEIPNGDFLNDALREYARYLISEANRVRTLQLTKIVFSGEVSKGVLYLNVHMYGHSEGQMREIAEKRMLHAISTHAPVILRVADIKPILKDIKVILDGKEVAPQQIIDTDKKKTGKVDKEGRITLSVLEDVWPYFSAMARTVIEEIRGAGINVTAASFDIKGRREFEVNAKLVVETDLPRESVENLVRSVITRHSKDLGKTLNRYITVHNIEVETVEKAVPAVQAKPKSAKAVQIIEKKTELEKEVEKLLEQAGIDELTFLTEEKKKESEQALLKSRIEPAMETLKARLHTELKLIPRVTFKWLKLSWDVQDSTVYVSIEASFLKEEVGGLFGSFSGVDEEKLKNDAKETILRAIRDVSREYSISIKLSKLNVIVR
ncbi:DUF2226 domain-containing protein [Thermococcus waiotapuensis]|uniref:DUF2226 domain-containing protein n=1 Tax=Thermococcus waiotapuensis TaxID=90909 RepID=A0AAE4T482_9EURY|nr:DUF2226 domain-containing protein [Thermococcus waiotapuensis]MDV3104618.1 DUF2226 domain-containing protein [Thermococcus waiotapuensis]